MSWNPNILKKQIILARENISPNTLWKDYYNKEKACFLKLSEAINIRN